MSNPPSYLMAMPIKVLRAEARVIEKWLRTQDKVRPTLADLDAARRARRSER